MTLQQVIDNLKNTISGKEQALAMFESRKHFPRADIDQMAMISSIEFLKVNIAELKRILADVEAVNRLTSV